MLPPSVRALVRNVPTIAPIPRRAVLSVTGSQAAEFLNGIVASTIPQSPQSHFYSALLHAQGRVLYDVFVYAHHSVSGARGYLIEYDSRCSEAPPLLPMLKKYVLRSKVKLRDVTEEYDVWSAWGSDKEKIWETERKWNAVRSGAIEPVWHDEPQWPWGTEPRVLRDRRAMGMGHRLLVRKGDKPQEASTHDVASSDAYLLHRILNGVPEGVTDIPPTHAFPMDSNLDIMGALDFRKGCYVGQELTVRTYHTGVLRKRILPVLIDPVESSPDAATDSPKYQQFLADADIRARHVSRQEDDVPKPRPRGSGKLLSSIHGVGLALLRLEQVASVESGSAIFELKAEGDDRTWGVTHWWPHWWPRATPEEEQEQSLN